MVLGAVVLAGAVGFGAVAILRDDDRPKAAARAKATREGSDVVPDAAPVAIMRTPARFRIVYRLEDFTGSTVGYSTDVVSVRRPFESRLETRTGRPPGGEVESFQAARFAKRVT